MKQLRFINVCSFGLFAFVTVGCASWSTETLDLSRSPYVSPGGETARKPPTTSDAVIRNQNPCEVAPANWQSEVAPGTDHYRHGMPVSGGAVSEDYVSRIPAMSDGARVAPVQFNDSIAAQRSWSGTQTSSSGQSDWQSPAPSVAQLPPGAVPPIGNGSAGSYPPTTYSVPTTTQQPVPGSVGVYAQPPPNMSYQNPGPVGPPRLPPPNLGQVGQTWSGPQGSPRTLGVPTPYADIFVNVAETQTGKLMIGAAVNSDAGVTGQVVIDERNFDLLAVPTSFDDFVNGSAFRGAGQGFRLEALPGDEVQRYMLQFTEPFLLDTRISMNLSAFLFDRRYFDWDEQRLGGRLGFGYRVTPDLSLGFTVRAEEIQIRNPRVATVPQLNDVLGDSDLYSGRVTLTQDTRNIPFAPTQGYFLELSYEQVFGSFDYGRFEGDFRRYFLLNERPDGSGRHVLGFSNRVGISGEQTPVFENFFAGGYQTLRGFDFRRAVPMVDNIGVGGRLRLLGSVEYLFPITADDMLKGVVFTDYGTVEEDIKIDADDFRVALGLGLRITVPAMGPAPIALDFAVPVAREDTDEIRNFSFFMGVSR